jgi:methylmalonyl-CoA mutase N-terminal domain/subunit
MTADEREKTWTSASGIPLQPFYRAADVPAEHRADADGAPGEGAFLRGAYPTGYRTKPWRIFQLSGFGKPEDENERIKMLLAHGETGFIMEHDRNTADHMYDADHPEVVARARDVGLTGAVMQSVNDIAICLDGIPLEATYGHAGGGVVQHAPFALAGYWTVARRRGLDLSRLPGTGQSDFNLTYLGCPPKQQIPTGPGLRFNIDIVEFCAEHLPRWVPVSIAAYNAADSGINAYQELGALFANAIEYLDEVQRRGKMEVAQAARGVGGVSFRLSMDLFEEACKMRAARKMWSTLLRERYGINDPKVANLRIHCVTAGSRMTYQQPLNNIVRGTLMGLAGILGGIQSLGVSGYDEALSIPSEHAHQMSVRIQQILQNETNLTAVADPLGGSHYAESLTAELIERGRAFQEQILEQGGYLACLDSGWLQARAAENQVAEFEAHDKGEQIVVGVNAFAEDISPHEIDGFMGVDDAYDIAIERVKGVRANRDGARASAAMQALAAGCRGDDNVMPLMMEAMDAEVTLGEVGDVFRDAFGDWQSPIAM